MAHVRGRRARWGMNRLHPLAETPAFTQWDRLVNTKYWQVGKKLSTGRVIRIVCDALCCMDPV
eukprot:3064844-Rhodomonas_salina.1